MRQAAPEENPPGHGLDIHEHGRSGGAEAGKGFENAIHHGLESPAQIERQPAEEACREPAQGNNGHAFTMGHGRLGGRRVAKDEEEERAGEYGDAH
jgi:hypothetical protein